MLRKRKNTEVYALGRHISLSAYKARRVIDQIRGRSYEETLMILEFMPYRAFHPILQLVYSAAANATYNMGSVEANLVIRKVEVNEGTTAKKFKPRARGRSYAIKITTCHITIVVKDISLDEYEYEEMYSLKNPIGDVIVAVIKEAVPKMPLEKSEVVRVVIVRTCKELKRDSGMIIRYDDNAAVLIDKKGNPKGTRIFGAIPRELRQRNFTKIVSLAPEVLYRK